MLALRFIAVLLFSISSATAAEELASRESVHKLMDLTGASKMIDAMYSQVDQMFEGMAENMGITEAERPAFDRYMKKVAAMMREDMSWEELKEPMTDIYVRNFTEKEVQGLIEFYSSDIGRSMIDKMPIVMQESMAISQDILKDTMPKIQALAEEMHREVAESRKGRAQQ